MKDERLTTSAGLPVADDNNGVSVGEGGALTFDNFQLLEKMSHFNRERIPERVVHARGAGAYATFELNRNMNKYFAEIEQAAFALSNYVPGIGASPDKMMQTRLLDYFGRADQDYADRINQKKK